MQHDQSAPQQSLTNEQLMNLHIPVDVMARRIDVAMWQTVVETTFELFAKRKEARAKRLSRLAEYASVEDPKWDKWAAYYARLDIEIRMPTSTRIEMIAKTGSYDDDKYVTILELREPRGIGKQTVGHYNGSTSERMLFPKHPNAIQGIVQSFVGRAVKEAFRALPEITDPDDYINVDDDPRANFLV